MSDNRRTLFLYRFSRDFQRKNFPRFEHIKIIFLEIFKQSRFEPKKIGMSRFYQNRLRKKLSMKTLRVLRFCLMFPFSQTKITFYPFIKKRRKKKTKKPLETQNSFSIHKERYNFFSFSFVHPLTENVLLSTIARII